MGFDESNVEELGDIEAHTYYMYKNGYTESKLPKAMFIKLFFVRTIISKNSEIWKLKTLI